MKRRAMRLPVTAGLAAVLVWATLFFAGGLLLLTPTPAFADMTAVGGVAGAVYPVANTDIRMEAETVQAICYRYFAEYRVDFQFVNNGEAQTVQLGFPYLQPGPVPPAKVSLSPPVGFRAWQDGKPLTVSSGQASTTSPTTNVYGEPAHSFEAYVLLKATFPRGETMITISYLAEPTWIGLNRLPATTPPDLAAIGVAGQAAEYDYWLHTGAGWAGTIGKAVVRFQLADDFNGWAVDVKSSDPAIAGRGLPTTRPETYAKLDARTYQWVFNDLEPTVSDDIVLGFTNVGLYEVLQMFRQVHGAFPPKYGALPAPLESSRYLGTQWGGHPGEPKAGWGAVDEAIDSAWGVPAPGKGAWIKVGNEGNQDLKEIRILPGLNDYNPASFSKYGRPKTMRVTLSDGTTTVITLKDEPSLQRFAVSGKAEWVRFDITDIYPGTKSNQTYISTIDFGTEPAPSFLPFTALIEETAPGQAASGAATNAVNSPSASGPTTTAVGRAGTASSEAASPAAEFPGRIVWPIVGVVAGAGLVLLLAWTARRRRRRIRAGIRVRKSQ